MKVPPIREILTFDLTERGKLTRICGKAYVAGTLPKKMAEAMAREAYEYLKNQPECRGVPIQIEAVHESKNDAVGNGSGISLVAETSSGCRLSGSELGKRGVPSEKVGKDAATKLLCNLKHGGCVDDYLQDQVILFMALANGHSRVLSGPITLHTQTAVHIAETLTSAKFEISQMQDSSGRLIDQYLIECNGIGLRNVNL